ncbi:uncharacterized protein [Dysidea avara]|uniref:uncharacterized protein isoform X1 n=1 Tax=Dysidea avara TaxID=196820 RepID=UPI00332C2EB9
MTFHRVGMIVLLAIVVLLCSTGRLTLVAATDHEQCDTYEFSLPFFLGNSCKEIYDWNPQTHNRSGYYWLINPLREVYCDMEQRVVCGNTGGWTRIASVNITRGDECPTGWNKASLDGINFCRSPSDNAGCYPVQFSSKGLTYQKVCGMARGYQKGTTDAFWQSNVDGLSITHGNPPEHIWSYVAGYTDLIPAPVCDNHCHCPCASVPGDEPNLFVGFNYYCEVGAANEIPNVSTYLFSDPLWDGSDCPANNSCCDNPNLPWFHQQLDTATADDVEVRICTDEDFNNEAVVVEQLELYIQ